VVVDLAQARTQVGPEYWPKQAWPWTEQVLSHFAYLFIEFKTFIFYKF
jgi:hypothetical protein